MLVTLKLWLNGLLVVLLGCLWVGRASGQEASSSERRFRLTYHSILRIDRIPVEHDAFWPVGMSNGHAFLMAREIPPRGVSSRFYRLCAFDQTSGTLRWTSARLGRGGPGFENSYLVQVAAERVFLFTMAAGLYAFDLSDGHTLWSREHDPWLGQNGFRAGGNSVWIPSFEGNGPNSRFLLSAFDASNGSKRWRFAGSDFVSKPVHDRNGNLYLGSGSHVYALNAKTGEVSRTIDVGLRGLSRVHTDKGTLYAVERWAQREIECVDLASGKRKWSLTLPINEDHRPRIDALNWLNTEVIGGEALFLVRTVGKDAGPATGCKVWAVDKKNGNILWEKKTAILSDATTYKDRLVLVGEAPGKAGCVLQFYDAETGRRVRELRRYPAPGDAKLVWQDGKLFLLNMNYVYRVVDHSRNL